MAFLGTITKQPIETASIPISYVNALAGRAGSVGTPVVTVAAGITATAPVVTGTTATFQINGGASGQTYGVEVTTVLTIGAITETVQDELLIVVQEVSATSEPPSWIGGQRPIEDALPYIVPYANGCPEALMLFHLQQSVLDWCEKTLCWRQTLPDVLTRENIGRYVMPLPSNSALVKILAYRYEGKDARVAGPDIGEGLQAYEWGDDAVWTVDRATFAVNPTPREDGRRMSLTVALKPVRDHAAIPGEVFEHYIKALAHGALAGILDVPNQPWTNTVEAAKHLLQYRDARASAKWTAHKGFGRSRIRVKAQMY